MNLTQITARIGSELSETDNLPFDSLPKVKIEKGEVSCSVKLVFDLSKNSMYFKFDSRTKTNRELYYFGTNQGNSAQIYLVRSLKGVKYLLGSVLSNLHLELYNYNMQDCELSQILQQLEKAGLYVQASKIKEGFLACDKWDNFKGKQIVFDREEGIFKISGQDSDVTVEKMIRDNIEFNPREKIVVVVPAVVFPDGSELLLNEHPDYHLLVRKALKLEEEEILELNQRDLRTCHLCRRRMSKVASDKYLTKLSRIGINKIFTTTTINSARDIKKAGYDDSYAVCQQCYVKLSCGELYIEEKLSTKIAGESVFILPEGLYKPFESYKYFPEIKKTIDFAFQAKDAQEWYKKVILEAEEQVFTNGYTINLIFYRSDKTSITALAALEDVPPFRLMEIMRLFGVWKDRMREHVKSGMSLRKVYQIIPVRSDKKNKQLNIQRVLDVYKALLLRQLINPRLLFQYAMEAVDKGFSQIQRQKRDVYKNLPYYSKENSDFYLCNIVMKHLVLIQVMQEINVLSKPIFRKDVKIVQHDFQNVMTQESIRRMESFVQEQGFNTEAKGLFYLGALLHRVALVQYSKGYKSKPILKKINFQGMKPRDMHRLFADLTEKLMQYRRMSAFSDALMNRHQVYYGPFVTGVATVLDELQNVFFLLAGYSFMVGKKTPDATKEEEEVMQGMMSDNEKEQEDN
ncbi:MAG: hypothetical protein VR68_04655 [Peptococcaceae bacterium BRH_c4a]|nr:MAG: hypothetical protein VR68_04655 [Peptococcaceae bacterium BRH_c4a]